jgi:hypothetical protein
MRARTLLILPALGLLLPLLVAAQSPVTEEPPLPEKIETAPLPGEEPAVTIRRLEGGDIVEEYRVGDRLTEVRVRPATGTPYTLVANRDGRLSRRMNEGPIAPVYYTLYEWD